MVLKALLEDGLLNLDDGRRILCKSLYELFGRNEQDICIHDDFRLFVLANRPGYPFLGNDFFREAGDCFSVHVIENPDPSSQMAMLKAYAENGLAKDSAIQKLIGAFDELRGLYEQGLLSYPYSIRELVNVVKHMDSYPDDGLSNAVDNVLSWDGLGTGNKQNGDISTKNENSDTASMIHSVLLRHGINVNDLKRTSGPSGSLFNISVTKFAIEDILVKRLANTRDIPFSEYSLTVKNSAFKFGSSRKISPVDVTLDTSEDSVGYLSWQIGT